MGTVHYSAGRNGRLMPAGTTLVGIAALDRIVFPTATHRADKAVRKPQMESFRPAGILGIIASSKFLESDRISLSHNDVPLVFVRLLSHINCPIFRTFTRYRGLLS